MFLKSAKAILSLLLNNRVVKLLNSRVSVAFYKPVEMVFMYFVFEVVLLCLFVTTSIVP